MSGIFQAFGYGSFGVHLSILHGTMSLMDQFSFQELHQHKGSSARTGIIHTPHGDIQTPAFIPVGTQASVKSLTPDELTDLSVQMFFVNTYHMYLRPGIDVVERMGGLHPFMDWHHPIITDSGGFQVFSLGRKRFARKNEEQNGESELVKITDESVTFRSHWDGSEHVFTPESSMRFQWGLASDIHIAFDDCTSYPVDEKTARRSMDRTHVWAKESLETHNLLWDSHKGQGKPYQALYGSIQGSIYQSLREQSASFITGLPFDGFAVGGVSVGETKKEMVHVMDWVCPLLPAGKPRHLLGVGELDDVFHLVEHGFDTFDCVQPTRLARMGFLYKKPVNADDTTKSCMLDIQKQVFHDQFIPVDSTCTCYTCTHVTRAYLHHLFSVRELLGYRLATIHNIHVMNTLVSQLRLAIAEDSFVALKQEWNVE